MSKDLLEKEYISKWTQNAKQHFADGDYEWVCDVIQQCFPNEPCKRILELGCGAGYSTLVFLLHDYQVVSVDINDEAIEHTDSLIKKYGHTSRIKNINDTNNCHVEALLWKKDFLHELGQIRTWVELQEQHNPIDLIVLCNPGGNISRDLTKRELELLQWGGFAYEEILAYYHNGWIDLLHKWAMIYASCVLSQLTYIPLLSKRLIIGTLPTSQAL